MGLSIFNKEFLETNYLQGRAIGVFRWFHFDLKIDPKFFIYIPAFAGLTVHRHPRAESRGILSIKMMEAMDKKETLIRLIEKKINENDSSSLDEFLIQNPGLEPDKETYCQIIFGIRERAEKKLRSELSGYLRETLENKTVSKIVSFKAGFIVYGGIAASLLIAGFFYINYQGDLSNEPMKLFIEDTPVHSDSAIFETDSAKSKIDSIKIIDK